MTNGFRVTLAIAGVLVTVGLVGCAGDDDEPDVSAAPPQSEDYALTRMSTLGLREGFFTITGRSDGRTTAVVDFYVPIENGSEDDLYRVAVRTGDCDPGGAVQQDLGTVSAGTTVQVLDVQVADLADALESNEASVVIMTPDGTSIAWCGPEV